MKKTFLLFAALLMMGSAAFAGGGFDIAIGPKVGYQTAKLSYNKANIKSDFSNHFTAGVFGRVTIGRLYVISRPQTFLMHMLLARKAITYSTFLQVLMSTLL